MLSYTVTLIGLAAAAALFAFTLYKQRRPLPLGEVRLVPLGALQFVAIVAAMLFAAHLVSLLTGHPFTSRWFH